ncbi:LacI family transcriptional regulator [bacterium 1XD21-13]|nr:LacI family transcriptional regulator [bacterium 1XD21-13]
MTTLKDIAKKAGVNVSTVSRALNNSKEISKDTRDLVQKIAKELDYEPNYSARVLVGKKTKTIGVIVPEVSSNYFATMIDTIENGLQDKGYSLLIGLSHHKLENELYNLKVFWNRKVDGILIAGSMNDKINPLLDLIKNDGIPVVLIHSFINHQNYDYVAIDDVYGLSKLVSFLKEQGHQSLGYIASELASRFRIRALKQIIKENGMELKTKYIKIGEEANELCGYKYMNEILKERVIPTAIIAAYDYIAIGAMRALYENGFRIPEDISIVGYDNIRESKYLRCPLTTISPPIEKMVNICLEIMFDKIMNKPSEDIHHIFLKPDLIVRSSTSSLKSI